MNENMAEAIGELAGEVELVPIGKRGVTNAQMIPVLRQTLKENDTDKLLLLKVAFPAVYTSSIKYLTKDEKAKLEALA